MGHGLDPHPLVAQKSDTDPLTGKPLSELIGNLGCGYSELFMFQPGGNQIDEVDQLLPGR